MDFSAANPFGILQWGLIFNRGFFGLINDFTDSKKSSIAEDFFLFIGIHKTNQQSFNNGQAGDNTD